MTRLVQTIVAGLRSLKRLPSDRRGVVSYIALFAIVPLTAALFLIVNTGQDSYDRIVAQNGADALAMTHATWSARTLNTMSMNNVALTQAAAVGIVSTSLEGTLDELRLKALLALAEIWGHVLQHPPCKTKLTFPWCVADAAFMSRPAYSALDYVSATKRRYNPGGARDMADRTVRALNAFNQDLVDSFPEHVRQASDRVAQANGIANFYFHDRCSQGQSCRQDRSPQGMELPVSQNSTSGRAEFCEGYFIGTAEVRTSYVFRGFDRGRGPYFGGGSRQRPNVKSHVNQLTRIGSQLRYFKQYYDWRRLPLSERKIRLGRYLMSQRRDENNFTRSVACRNAQLCDPTGVSELCRIGSLESLFTGFGFEKPQFYVYDGQRSPFEIPKVTAEAMPPSFKILTFARRELAPRLGDASLVRGMPDSYAYAQSLVYNRHGASLFSQAWEGRLMPATRFADPAEVGARMRREAPHAFGALAERLEHVRDRAGWGAINAH